MSNQTSVTDVLRAGLRAAELRQSAIANNLANLNTPGFRRSTVDFEQRLAEALGDGNVKPEDLEPALRQPLSTPINGLDNDVDMDMEIGELVKNGVQYKTYVRLLAKLRSQVAEAMRTE